MYSLYNTENILIYKKKKKPFGKEIIIALKWHIHFIAKNRDAGTKLSVTLKSYAYPSVLPRTVSHSTTSPSVSSRTLLAPWLTLWFWSRWWPTLSNCLRCKCSQHPRGKAEHRNQSSPPDLYLSCILFQKCDSGGYSLTRTTGIHWEYLQFLTQEAKHILLHKILVILSYNNSNVNQYCSHSLIPKLRMLRNYCNSIWYMP